MNSIFKLIILLALSLTVFDCTEPGEIKSDDVTILTVGLPESKSYLGASEGGQRKVYWANGDRLCLNGVASNPLSGVPDRALSVKFSFPGVLNAPFSILYPASAYADASHINFPESQAYTPGSFDPSALVLVGHAATFAGSIGMSHLTALVKIPVKATSGQNVTLSEITFEGNGGEQVSGSFTIDYEEPSLTGTSTAVADKKIKLSVGQSLSSSDPLDIFIAVPARTYAQGFTITLKDSNGLKMIKRKNASTLLSPGKLVNMPVVEFAGEALPEANISGLVQDSSGNPLEGVAVSDGVIVTTTGADGRYHLMSGKENGYVFISQPEGYEVPLEGVFPQFWQALGGDSSTEETHDFILTPVDNSDCLLLAIGDLHLCNRNALKDLRMFRLQAAEFKNSIQTLLAGGRKVYGLTLGDMTWDIYWDDNQQLAGCNFDLSSYRTEINSDLSGIHFPLWHTMGNHDNAYYAVGDWDAAIPYKQIIGPTCYSFNMGGYHIVSLDNVICENGGHSNDRADHAGLAAADLAWLQADIAIVPSSVPVIVSMHEPAYTPSNPTGSYSSADYASTLLSALGNRNVHIITGHTHNINNAEVSSSVYEHNGGAPCASWWWTGRHSIEYWNGTTVADIYQIGRDGSPAGYTLYALSSGSMEWEYIPFGLSADRQFKTYDRNSFALSADIWCPNATDERKTTFEKLAKKGDGTYSYVPEAGTSGIPSNLVYINVWNHDPSWSISVTENGSPLTVTPLTIAYDPMHMVAYSATRLEHGNNTTSTFVTSKTQHLFRVQASSPTSTLEIRVTDRFGNVYTETMTRPKSFGVNWD